MHADPPKKKGAKANGMVFCSDGFGLSLLSSLLMHASSAVLSCSCIFLFGIKALGGDLRPSNPHDFAGWFLFVCFLTFCVSSSQHLGTKTVHDVSSCFN